MDDRVGKRLGQLVGEPGRHLDDGRDLARRVDLPQLREAAHLALEVAAGAGERGERQLRDVRRMDLDERIDELLAEPAPRRRLLETRRQVARDDVAVEEPHHVEGHADHALVLADRDDRRQADPVWRERELEARLTHHVVRGRRKRGPRRPTQDEAVVAALEEEREVRAASVADPLRPDRPLAEAVLVEERLQAVEDDERRALGARRLGGRRDDVGSGGHGAILPRRRRRERVTRRTRAPSSAPRRGRPSPGSGRRPACWP